MHELVERKFGGADPDEQLAELVVAYLEANPGSDRLDISEIVERILTHPELGGLASKILSSPDCAFHPDAEPEPHLSPSTISERYGMTDDVFRRTYGQFAGPALSAAVEDEFADLADQI